MKRLCLTLMLFFYTPMLWAYSVSAEGDYVIKWPFSSITYYLQQDGAAEISSGADLNAIRDAAAAWSAVSCSSLQLIEAATISSKDTVISTNDLDGKSVITWDNWSGFHNAILAVTVPVYDSSYGTISEADIVFNPNQTWSTSSSNYPHSDIESVAVHELGHFFGAQHVIGGETMSDPPTMSPTMLSDLESRSLSTDDQLAVCFLYPESVYACSNDDDCPRLVDGNDNEVGQINCDNNSCVGFGTVSGDGILGDACYSTADCSGTYFCQEIYGGGSYCSEDCNPNISTSCPSGFDCLSYSNSNGGACIPDGSSGSGSSSSGGTTPGGSASGETSYGCSCDLTTICDGNCFCDPECLCECDLTTICDGSCGCDPECNSGCAALGSNSTDPKSNIWWFLLLTALSTSIWVRRKIS